MERFLEDIQIRHRMIKETTGVAWTVVMIGSSRIRTVRFKDEIIASINPKTIPKKKPKPIFAEDNRTVFQKSSSKVRTKSL